MSTVAEYNYFYRVDVDVRGIIDGTNTAVTYTFTNKTLKDSTSLTTFWPILRSIGEVSLTSGETLPTVTISSIEIDNRIGSFGSDRKFSDILQRYSPVEQPLTISYAQVVNNSDTVTTWTVLATAVVESWDYGAAAGDMTLTFNVRPMKYVDNVLTLEVANTISGMENAPSSSLGRAVPLLIGDDLDVLPVRISADDATTAKYAWGTCLYEHLKNVSTGYSLYTKNYLDQWEEIDGGFPDYSGATSTGTYTLNTYADRAFDLNLNGNGIVTGVQLEAQGNGLVSSTAFLSVYLLRTGASSVVIEEVGRGRLDLSNYNAQNAASTARFSIKVSLDQPVFLSGNSTYALGWSCTGYQPNDLSLHYHNLTRVELRRDAADATSPSNNSFTDWKRVISATCLAYKLLEPTVSLTDHVSTYTQTGLTYSSLTLTQFTPDSGQTNPSFDNFPILLANVKGLSNYSGATLQEKPQDITNKLSYTWSTTSLAWSDAARWDTTTLSSSHYDYLYNGATPTNRSRVVRGVFDQRSTYTQIVSEIARCTASKVGIFSSGKTFMWPWGITAAQSVYSPILTEDISPISWQQRDLSTVINRAVIKTGRSFLASPRGIENTDAEGRSSYGYNYSEDYSSLNYPSGVIPSLTRDSVALYGVRDLQNTEFPLWPYPSGGLGGYIGGTSSTGSILAEYYLTRYAKPLTYCTFIVPYHRYASLKMFDIITFAHPSFPAYYGTDPQARNGVVNVSGAVTEVVANGGFEMVRAQSYRGLIEGITHVLAMEHAPALKLTVLVLLNYPKDPT